MSQLQENPSSSGAHRVSQVPDAAISSTSTVEIASAHPDGHRALQGRRTATRTGPAPGRRPSPWPRPCWSARSWLPAGASPTWGPGWGSPASRPHWQVLTAAVQLPCSAGSMFVRPPLKPLTSSIRWLIFADKNSSRRHVRHWWLEYGSAFGIAAARQCAVHYVLQQGVSVVSLRKLFGPGSGQLWHGACQR